MAHLIENILKTLLHQGRALHVFDCASSLARRSPDSVETGLCFCLASFSMTVLSSHKSICVLTMRPQGSDGAPLELLLLEAFKRGGKGYTEVHKEYVRLGAR